MEKRLRDLEGYGGKLPDITWPGGRKLAVQFVLNLEEGGENSVIYGDEHSETFLSEIIGAEPFYGKRHMSIESLYEYGTRAGVWRILQLFRDREIPLTVFAVSQALQENQKVVEQILKDNHEICSHGLRWINYRDIPRDVEKEHMEKAIEIQKNLCGSRPLGWYTGRTSENTRDLVCEEGGFVYDSDDYSDDLPFWSKVTPKPHLIIPYTLDTNDMRFLTNQGFNNGNQFFNYLKDTFDCLYQERFLGPKMMSIGLHCRIIGKPGRFGSLKKFLDYTREFSDVWFASRISIANYWRKVLPYEE
jgi:allantoinase|tara:strand:+ start:143 stop:1051 length:909 start_codon:yes stop_codon:yes gene_type:complete